MDTPFDEVAAKHPPNIAPALVAGLAPEPTLSTILRDMVTSKRLLPPHMMCKGVPNSMCNVGGFLPLSKRDRPKAIPQKAIQRLHTLRSDPIKLIRLAGRIIQVFSSSSIRLRVKPHATGVPGHLQKSPEL
ncbi:hypothetical protein MMC18_007526 [Xylographa bjoerkii]|nr:hypothetical protein [Xylographa bjoerkii]